MVTKSRYRNESRRLINTALENMIFAEILLEYFFSSGLHCLEGKIEISHYHTKNWYFLKYTKQKPNIRFDLDWLFLFNFNNELFFASSINVLSKFL